MRVLDAATEIVQAHPERARPGTGWPCCEFVGRALLRAAGRTTGPAGFWTDMCIHDPGEPWSPAEAARAIVGPQPTAPGRVVRPAAGVWGEAQLRSVLDGLVVGRWHVVQRWTHLAADGTAIGLKTGGHTVLLRYDGDATGLILESSVRDGVRLGGLPWTGPRPNVGSDSVLGWLTAGRAGLALVPLWEGA